MPGPNPAERLRQRPDSDNAASQGPRHSRQWTRLDCPALPTLPTRDALSNFLQQVEHKAYRRALFHVRDGDAALDIVQDSMIKLATHYGDKPAEQWPMLFQRILWNTVLDWFRRQKTRQHLFTSMEDLGHNSHQQQDRDWLDIETGDVQTAWSQSAEALLQQWQTLAQIEEAIASLPARQREAFLLRYWEELNVAETAAVMGCTEGSVKTHCSRAVQALSQRLSAQGIKP